MKAGSPAQKVRCYYWLESTVAKNLGDHLAAIVLAALGYHCVSRNHSDSNVANSGRCLLPIGSVLWEHTFERITEPVDVWGCGWRGTSLSSAVMARVQFHAVRGPRTAAGLGLSAHIPLGDPALLLPYLRQQEVKQHGRTLVVPHFFQVDHIHAAQRCRLTGCDELLSMRVLGAPVPGQRMSPRRLPGMVKARVQLGIPVHTAWQAIQRIAGADFVLTGSLHGAILAQAYGVPWASYDDGYVDVPEKWHDWADYLGIQMRFVSTLAEGEQWWQTEGRNGAIRDLAPLLSAFPYPIDSAICQQPNLALSSYP
jgi:hypothetical protein